MVGAAPFGPTAGSVGRRPSVALSTAAEYPSVTGAFTVGQLDAVLASLFGSPPPPMAPI
jgi:hypothetical protein